MAKRIFTEAEIIAAIHKVNAGRTRIEVAREVGAGSAEFALFELCGSCRCMILNNPILCIIRNVIVPAQRTGLA